MNSCRWVWNCSHHHLRQQAWVLVEHCCDACLQAYLKVNGPVLQLPKMMTDITKAQTIIHLAAPNLTLVLDPLLYLKTLSRGPGIPKLIHMTLKDKHLLAPHQILSMLSWGRFNEGYALLLYDDDDITNYMLQYNPGFMPSELQHCRDMCCWTIVLWVTAKTGCGQQTIA